jgi:hypothetical protein
MELDLSVSMALPMTGTDEPGNDELPGITAETATQVFGIACRHGVRLRVAAHWIMRAHSMTVRSLAGELEVSVSHLNRACQKLRV